MRSSSTLSQITLILILVALLVGPIVLGAIRPWIFLPLFFLLSLASLFGIYRAAKSLKHFSWKPDLIDISVAAFTLYAIGRYWTSPIEYDSRLEILKVISYAMIFFLCRYGIERRIQGMTILFSLLFCGVGLALFGFFLKANPGFHPYGETFHLHYAPRLTSTYGCPNHIGYFLVVTTSIAFSIGFFSHLSWIVRIIVLYSTVPMIAAIAFTLSRGSWIALFFALFAITIVAVRLGKMKRWIPIALLLLTIGGGVGFVAFNQNFKQRLLEGFDSETLKVNDQYIRVQLLIDSIKIFKDYPLYGTGPATFLYVHPRYQGPTYPTLAVFTHNDYANTLTDYGIIGLFLALLFVVTASIKLSRAPERGERWHDRIFLSSAAAAMSALIIHSFFDFNLHIPANAMVFFALTGLGLRLTNDIKQPEHLPPWRYWPLILIAPIFFLHIFFIQKTAQGYFPSWGIQRQSHSIDHKQRIEILKAAAKKDPQSTAIATSLGDHYRLEAAQHKEKEIRYPLALQSIHWYQKARELNPIDDTITIRLAMTYDLMERYMEAYQFYRQGIRNQPYSGYFWVELAAHYWRQGLLSKAKEIYEAALACPYHPSNMAMEMEILDKAIEKAKESLKHSPSPENPSSSSTPPQSESILNAAQP